MGLTQSKPAVGDLTFDARGPEGGAVVVLLQAGQSSPVGGRIAYKLWGSRIPGSRFRPAWLFRWYQTARRG